MFTARKKIIKEKGAEPDDFEETVAQVRFQGKGDSHLSLWKHTGCTTSCTSGARGWLPLLLRPHEVLVLSSQLVCRCMQALFDLEATNNELKADLRDLYITAAKEVDTGSRKAIIVHVSNM